MKEARIYETSNVDLATYLVYEGIKLLECTKKPGNSKIVVMRFIDDKGLCLDLERIFIKSDFKKFRDVNKWLLTKVHQILREN